VRPKVNVADIGTDHAYLCAHLALHGAGHCLGTDVAGKPLLNAAKTLRLYGLSDRVELRLSDGLDNIAPHEADDILLLGMGGTLIARLLGRCDWIRSEGKRLILQPMSRAEEVRAWLCGNGFAILQETVVREGRRLYLLIQAMQAISNERSAINRGTEKFPFGYEYYGELPKVNTPEAAEYLEHVAVRLEKKSRALRAAGLDDYARETENFAAAVSSG
jgi:tRNA (adenine22-N1)-methyltransferase